VRAAFLLGEKRRDVRTRPVGARRSVGGRSAIYRTAEDLSLRMAPSSDGFVTSPDQGGRYRLLGRFALANLTRRAS
jgi:hypothetical protein